MNKLVKCLTDSFEKVQWNSYISEIENSQMIDGIDNFKKIHVKYKK